jgi:hypothetical protein
MKIKQTNRQFLQITGLCLFCIFAAGCICGVKTKVTENDVLQAQEDWGNEVVAVGKAYTDGKNYQKTASFLAAL